jgi:hypothetical protein
MKIEEKDNGDGTTSCVATATTPGEDLRRVLGAAVMGVVVPVPPSLLPDTEEQRQAAIDAHLRHMDRPWEILKERQEKEAQLEGFGREIEVVRCTLAAGPDESALQAAGRVWLEKMELQKGLATFEKKLTDFQRDLKKHSDSQREMKKHCTALAGGLIWALKFLHAPGSGVWCDPKTMHMKRWEEHFMDLLDSVGVQVDREEFWGRRDKKKPVKKTDNRTTSREKQRPSPKTAKKTGAKKDRWKTTTPAAAKKRAEKKVR